MTTDESKIRLTAFWVLGLTGIYILTGYAAIPLFLAADFALRSFNLGRWSPLFRLSAGCYLYDWLQRLFLFLFLLPVIGHAQQPAAKPPHVLVVIAHPDDESILAVTLYKIAKEHNGIVDLFVITNGEAGYKYSVLAESYYHCKLTDEKEGRKRLPAIRRQELERAGAILGVSHYFFANQRDDKYCTNERDPLDSCWDLPLTTAKLRKTLLIGQYDYVLCLLPDSAEHGAHKAASLLALAEVARLPAKTRPVILGARIRNKTDSLQHFSGYRNYALTRTVTDTAMFAIDRTTPFSYNNRLNYKVIANWEIAEHKTQGATQMTMNDGDWEEFWYFKQDNPNGIDRSRRLFNILRACVFSNSPCPNSHSGHQAPPAALRSTRGFAQARPCSENAAPPDTRLYYSPTQDYRIPTPAPPAVPPASA
ncbi:MAG TPA: PIG-L family deacetylase [Puia sp.]